MRKHLIAIALTLLVPRLAVADDGWIFEIKAATLEYEGDLAERRETPDDQEVGGSKDLRAGTFHFIVGADFTPTPRISGGTR